MTTASEQHDHLRQQRDEFHTEWQLTEKAFERIAGLILIFAGALAILLDKPGDQFTALAVAGFISGGFTMIFRSRRSSDKRQPLAFVRAEKLSQRVWWISAGIVIAILLGVTQDRFLFLLIAGLLTLLRFWYSWREKRIRHFDTLFPKPLWLDKEQVNNE